MPKGPTKAALLAKLQYTEELLLAAVDHLDSCVYGDVWDTRTVENLREWKREYDKTGAHGLPHLDSCGLKYGQSRCTCGLLSDGRRA